jgi:hypothetical protein
MMEILKESNGLNRGSDMFKTLRFDSELRIRADELDTPVTAFILREQPNQFAIEVWFGKHAVKLNYIVWAKASFGPTMYSVPWLRSLTARV